MASRNPTRLTPKANIGSKAFPNELAADFNSGDLTLYDENGSEKMTIPSKLSINKSGSGDTISDVSVSGHTITITKKQAAAGAKAVTYQANIGTNWTGSKAPYNQTITVNGIKSTDIPIIDINLSSVSYANKDKIVGEYAKIYRITTTTNGIVVYADDKTTEIIPIQIKVVE